MARRSSLRYNLESLLFMLLGGIFNEKRVRKDQARGMEVQGSGPVAF